MKHFLRKKKKKKEIYKRFQMYSSASSDRFSDFQFDIETLLNCSILNHNYLKNNKNVS